MINFSKQHMDERRNFHVYESESVQPDLFDQLGPQPTYNDGLRAGFARGVLLLLVIEAVAVLALTFL